MDRSSAFPRGIDLARRWCRAAFTLDTRSLAAFRIGLGLVLIADCLLRFRTFHLMFAADGLFPPAVLGGFQGTAAKWWLALVSDSPWCGGAGLAAAQEVRRGDSRGSVGGPRRKASPTRRHRKG